MLKKIFIQIPVFIIAGLLFTTSVGAKGATTYNDVLNQPYTCEEIQIPEDTSSHGVDTEYKVCYMFKGVSHFTQTPSKNVSVHFNGRSLVEFYMNDELVYGSEFKDNQHTLLKNVNFDQGEFDIFVSGGKTRGTSTFPEEKCTYKFHFHFSNDRTQFDRFNQNCELK